MSAAKLDPDNLRKLEAEVERMKKLHPPLANLAWPARGEAKP